MRGVQVPPGQMALTRMLWRAKSMAMFLDRLITAALAAEYAAQRFSARMPAVEAMLTMTPPPRFLISGIATCEQRYTEVRLVSTMKRHSSSLASSTFFIMLLPATLNRTSSPPKRLTVAGTMAATASRSLTSISSASA